jgi:serine/threonine protein kinase
MRKPRQFQVDDSTFISPTMIFTFAQDMKAFAQRGRKRKAQLIRICDLLIEDEETRSFLEWSMIDSALGYSGYISLHQIHPTLLLRLQRHCLDACLTIDPDMGRPYNLHGLIFVSVRGQGIKLAVIKSLRNKPFRDHLQDYFSKLQSRLVNRVERGDGEQAFADLAQIDRLLEARSHPKQLGQYRIVRELSTGSTETVYLAKDQLDRNERAVALKVLHPHLVRDSSFFTRFVRGADVLANLQHPNIARVLCVSDVIQGYAFYVTDYPDNGTINQLVARPDVTTEMRLSLLAKIISALAYLHRNGIVHLNLKPSNVLLTKDLEPKLMDFETAYIEGLSTLTLSPLGSTFQYISEERILNPSERNADNDIYSFGILALELLNRRVGLSKEEHIRRIVEPDQLRPYYPVLARCLQPRSPAISPLHRYKDANILAQAWEHASRVDPKRMYHIPIVIGSRKQGLSLRNEVVSDRVFDRLVIPQSNFRNSKLIRCSFRNCVLSDAVFVGTTMEDCDFEGSFLIMSRFQNATLSNTHFRYTNLERTVWDEVDLAGINFFGSNLWGAFLAHARNFESANFKFCNFCRTELTEVQQASIDGREDIAHGLLYSDVKQAFDRFFPTYPDGLWWLKLLEDLDGALLLY